MTKLAPATGLPRGVRVDRTLRAARALQQQGQLREAEQLHQAILALEPDHLGALCGLAGIRAQQGKCDEAALLLRRVAGAMSDTADAHAALGSMFASLDRPEDAIPCYEKALATRPDDAEVYNNLARALYKLGRFDEAIAVCERSLALEPGFADAHRTLGDMLQARDRHGEAVVHYEMALAMRPDDAATCNNLAHALHRLGRFREAIAQCRRALAIRPDYADAHHNLANALMALNRNEEAIAHYERTLALDPSRADAENNIGVALQALGRFAEAGRAYERAVRLAPRGAGFHLTLAHARPFTAGDPRLAAMEDLAGDMATLSEGDQIALHFALGKAFADLAEHERSFRHLLAGNALKRRHVAYDEAAVLGVFDRIRATFTRELMGSRSGGGDPSPVPVFVVGMPRSGTTLVEQILASHSQVQGAGEIDDFGVAVSTFARSKDASTGILDLLPALSGGQLREIGKGYLDRIRAAASAERIVNKLPSNFLYAGLIHLALPNARIIHACRDPVDTCFSCFSLLFSGEQSYAYHLGALGRYYGAYAALMAHWRNVLPDGVMIDVQYERVVDDLEGEARRIIAHCGLAWEDQCLAFHQTRRPVLTASSIQVRQPIYRGSVGRWRPYARLLAPLLQALEVEPPAAGSASAAAPT